MRWNSIICASACITSEKSKDVLLEKNRRRPLSAEAAGPDPLIFMTANGIIPNRSRNTFFCCLHSESAQITAKLSGYHLRLEGFWLIRSLEIFATKSNILT